MQLVNSSVRIQTHGAWGQRGKWKNTWVMGGWNSNETSQKTWAVLSSGAFLATSQTACPDNLSDFKQLTFPSKLLILSSIFD